MSSGLIWRTAIALLLVSGCAGKGEDAGSPDIELSMKEINMCLKEPGTTFVWQGFELRNSGEENLIISNIEIRGDKNCAFRCFREHADDEEVDLSYPCAREDDGSKLFQLTVPPGYASMVRIDYTAAEAGATDQAAVVITSNADTYLEEGSGWGRLVIPMCGAGYEPVDGFDAGVDAGGEYDAGGDSEKGRPDCPTCATLEKGAQGCQQ